MSDERLHPEYEGYEQGPIRPPSEARSLFLRLTRNCPWNHCTFCPVYKGARFSLRPVEHIKRDIDSIHRHVEALLGKTETTGRPSRREMADPLSLSDPGELAAFHAAYTWVFGGGMKSVFLQDANSLVMKPEQLLEVLRHLRMRFPGVERITSYARSHTLARMKDADLKALREAGLNRIHVGLESGADEVLEMTRKGVTAEKHIEAGLKVKRAGIQLSEYWMPGLGGRRLSELHARESARVLSRINPDFIRLRTLGLPDSAPLAAEYAAGRFEPCTETEVVREILSFIEALDGVTSIVASDHILNLLGDLEGQLPRDRQKMIAAARDFLDLPEKERMLYQVGRRMGIFHCTRDLEDPLRRGGAEEACRNMGITPENVDLLSREFLRRYI